MQPQGLKNRHNSLVFAFVSTKGGPGKTTLACNVAALCADMGKRVLLIDTDPQGSAGKYFTPVNPSAIGLRDVLRVRTLDERHISQTSVQGLSIVRADISIEDIDAFTRDLDRAWLLHKAIRNSYVLDNFDFIFIDSQGAKGTMQEAAALASDEIVTPLIPHMINLNEFLTGTLELFQRLSVVELNFKRISVLLNRVDHTRVANDTISALHDAMSNTRYANIGVCQTVIPTMVAIAEAQALRKPLHLHDPARRYKGPCSAEILTALVYELIPSLRGRIAQGLNAGLWPDDSPARPNWGRLLDESETFDSVLTACA